MNEKDKRRSKPAFSRDDPYRWFDWGQISKKVKWEEEKKR